VIKNLNIQEAPNSKVIWSLGECLHRGWRTSVIPSFWT